MNFHLIKKKLSGLRYTPLHPQWLIFRQEKEKMAFICNQAEGLVIDVGCASQTPKQYLPKGCDYYGLDYPTTANNWYMTQPNVYADGQKLPFKQGSIDSILLLDVIEHLPNPEQCINEIYRVLKPEGKLLLRVPFMYPIHDAPLDFHRWTEYGLKQLATNNNFTITNTQRTGNPIECAAIISNIALTKTALNWLKHKNPLALLTISLVLIIPFINLFGLLFSRLGSKDYFMPSSYTMTWKKNKTPNQSKVSK